MPSTLIQSLENNQPSTLTQSLAIIRSISCRSETATRQLLQDVAEGDPKKSAKLVNRIYDLLDTPSKVWLKKTLCPGLF